MVLPSGAAAASGLEEVADTLHIVLPIKTAAVPPNPITALLRLCPSVPPAVLRLFHSVCAETQGTVIQ